MDSIESKTLSLLTSSRYLRGGSSGGAGGGAGVGGGSGSGGYNAGNHHNRGGTGSGTPVGTVTFLIVVFFVLGFVLVIVFLGCCLMKCSSKFEESVSDARQETREQAKELKEGMDTPSNGLYMMSYSDIAGKICSGSVTLTFEDQGNGYDICGSIKDDDDASDIMEGFAAYDGTAYWKDTCIEGDVGLSVLSKGKFNYQTGVFTGTWESSTGVSGVYDTFHPVEPNSPEAVEQALPETFGQGFMRQK